MRPARPDDAEAIARVHTTSWQAAYRGIVPQSHLEGLVWEERRDSWAAMLAAGEKVVVAEDDALLAGFASCGPVRDADLRGEDIWEVYAIYAAPEDWGTGVGSALLGAVASRLPSGTCGLTAWVLSGNARGRDFYERSGFALDGGVMQAHIGGIVLDEVRYRLSVRP